MHKKILLAMILMMAMGFGAGRVHADNWSNDTDVSWYAAGPAVYSVGTARELAGLAKLVNGGNTFAGKTILLTANVDLSAKTWAPAGVWDNMVEENSRPFCGVFDGQGRTIDGLTVAITNALGCVSAGFFGSLAVSGTSTGTVKNLTLTSLSVAAHSSGENAYAAGVTAHGVKGIILNCVVAGSVTATTSNKTAYAGGVAGYIEGAFISNCTVSIAVSAVARESVANNPIINGKAGGVMGDMSAFSSILDCTVTGVVSGVVNGSSSYMDAGGVAGSGYAGTIRNCAFAGAVDASCVTAGGRMEAGGIIGGNQNGMIRDCDFSGGVTASSRFAIVSCAGGIAGKNYYGFVLNCMSSGSVTAASKSHCYAGGVTGDDVSGSSWNCSASGPASAFASNAGAGAHAGLVASLDGGGSISNCLALGAAYATSTGAAGVAYAGGLAGRIVSGKAAYSYWKRTGEPGLDRAASGGGAALGPCLSFGAAPGTLTNGVAVPGYEATANLLLALNRFAVMANTANAAPGFKFWAADGVRNGGYPFLTGADPRIIVAFDARGGEFAGGHTVTSALYFANGPYGAFPAATRSGYLMTAWTNSAGVAMTVESNVTAEGTNLYARWQSVVAPEITPGVTVVDIGCGGVDDYAVGVTSNIAWTVAAGEDWISVAPAAGGFTFDAASNAAVVSRSAAIVLLAADREAFPAAATVTVTQAASPVVFDGFEHGDSTNVPYAASSGVNGFGGNSPWRLETGETWITLLSPVSGTGNGLVAWTLEANSGSAARVGVVRLVQTGELGALTNLFAITQAAGAVEVTFNANGGEFNGGHTVTSVIYSLDVAYGQFPAAMRFGMVFGGWTNGPVTLATGMLAAPEPADVFAQWNAELPAPVVLPPSQISAKGFVARWRWVEGRAPEGELSVAADAAFTQLVPGYEDLHVLNAPECAVAGLLTGKDYWYRVRRVYPDEVKGPWSAAMKVRTGKGIPVFRNLLGDAPVSKGISQQFTISNLVSGAGTLKVKSSNASAVKATASAGVLTLQYLWTSTNAAKVTLTLTHPATGYKASYGATLSRAPGSVFKVGQSALTNAGTRAAQEVTLENRTGGMIYGLRLRALGLDNTAWLINRTGLDPVTKAAILEIPCVLPAGSQTVVRLIYNKAYKAQAATRPVKYAAWAIATPVHSAPPVTGEMALVRQDLYDGLWLLGLPANGNRLYSVYHSDDDGATWNLNVPVIRATANYLMWLDIDEGAPSGRLYRVVDAGM